MLISSPFTVDTTRCDMRQDSDRQDGNNNTSPANSEFSPAPFGTILSNAARGFRALMANTWNVVTDALGFNRSLGQGGAHG